MYRFILYIFNNVNDSLIHQFNSRTVKTFFYATQDLFLEKHVNFSTRFREGNEPSMLDYIFTNENYKIENLKHITPLGKSDHVWIGVDIHYILGYKYKCIWWENIIYMITGKRMWLS